MKVLPVRSLVAGLLAGVLVSAFVAAEPQLPAEDSEVTWLRTHAIPLRSVAPNDVDFTDLRLLRAAIGDARIVVLGEASHSDGTAFLAKTRLVRFLHQELGFDVLAFESGLYDCWKAARRIEAGKDPAAAFRESVFAIWTRSKQVQPLIDYFAAMSRTTKPITLTGFDSQFTGQMSERYLLTDLTHIAATVGLPAEAWKARIAVPLTNVIQSLYESGEKPEAKVQADWRNALGELEQRLRDQGEVVADQAFWVRLIASMRQLAETSWAMDWSKPLLDQPEYPVRDRQMGEHLVWLARERFPNRKIIAWMHNGHAARALNTVEVMDPEQSPYRTFQLAGAGARHKLGKDIYIVGVLAYQGEFARRGKVEEIAAPPAGSLEDLFHRANLPHSFLDLSHRNDLPQWLLGPLLARPIHYKEMRGSWPEIFDGILFIDRMQRSEFLPRR